MFLLQILKLLTFILMLIQKNNHLNLSGWYFYLATIISCLSEHHIVDCFEYELYLILNLNTNWLA